MKILISGGAGYIGSSIANFLARKGANVWVIDNLNNGNKDFLINKCKFSFSYRKRRKKDISYSVSSNKNSYSVSSNKKLLKITNFKPSKNYIKKMVLTSLKWYFKKRKLKKK